MSTVEDGVVPDDVDTTPEGESVGSLEEQGEIAADYLEEFLDIVDCDGDIDIDVVHDRASIAIVADSPGSLRHLVGRDGEVLDAIQELTRLAVQTKTGERSRLMLDIAGYRAGRREELIAVAKSAIAQARETGAVVSLEPMNSFERKIVHDVVTEAGLKSESRGIDPRRFIEVFAEDAE